MKSSSSSKGATTPVTDRDLMVYVDGELEGDRLADVERFASEDPTARRKVAALRLAGGIVRAHAAVRESAADSIADAVMGRIAAGALPELRDEDAAPSASNGVPPGKVVPIGRPEVRPAAPANDNSRRIWALAATAVAAAAAFMIWGKVDSGGLDPVTRTPTPITAQTTPTAVEVPGPAPVNVPTPDGDLDVGVEIAAVDFGNGQGSIFYVPTGATGAGHATAVVWLADDDSGGDQ